MAALVQAMQKKFTFEFHAPKNSIRTETTSDWTNKFLLIAARQVE